MAPDPRGPAVCGLHLSIWNQSAEHNKSLIEVLALPPVIDALDDHRALSPRKDGRFGVRNQPKQTGRYKKV